MDKTKRIREALTQLTKVAAKYNRSEEQPIKIEDGFSVTTREIHLIQSIGNRGSISVTALAQLFGVSKSAVSQMVKKLEKKGLIMKKVSPHSNKELELSLTELGWKGYEKHESLHRQDMDNIIEKLSVFSIEEISNLSSMLKAFEHVIDERLK